MFIDPKLIDVSKDGKYVYPVDSVTGHRTFAPIDYFKNMVQKKYGGSVEKFVKEYVTRETKKYLASGYTKEQVRDIASKCKNFKLPKIAKPKKDPRVPKKERKKRIEATSETVTNNYGEQEVIKTYPWSNNPDYFRSPHTPMDMAAATKDACWRPDVYLDDDCFGCPYYEICQNDMKHVIKKK
ncbi:MAG: hypothetical protein EB127_13775 [Alphaproteobacteria bacterium]|nr:hypothetical protein [Alphaproteobacteria bacterium]